MSQASLVQPSTRQLGRVRELGYATNFGESEDDVAAVAVAIPGELAGEIAGRSAQPSPPALEERDA